MSANRARASEPLVHESYACTGVGALALAFELIDIAAWNGHTFKARFVHVRKLGAKLVLS